MSFLLPPLLSFTLPPFFQLIIQSLCCVRLFESPWTAARQAPCPSLSPRVCSNSCPLNWWCHPTILFSVNPFFSCLQSFPASWSFPMSWLFASGGKSIEASASVFPMNNQDRFPLELTGLISLQSKEFSRVFSSTTGWSHQFVSTQPFLLSSCYIFTKPLEKTRLWLYEPLLVNWCLCFLICHLGLS